MIGICSISDQKGSVSTMDIKTYLHVMTGLFWEKTDGERISAISKSDCMSIHVDFINGDDWQVSFSDTKRNIKYYICENKKVAIWFISNIIKATKSLNLEPRNEY